MTPIPPLRLLAAVAISLAFSTPALLFAQTQTVDPAAFAAVALPEAPLPQDDPLPPQQASVAQPAAGPTPLPPCPVTPPAPASSSTQPAPGAHDAPKADPACAPALSSHDQAERQLKIEEKQRLLGVMPQFQVVMGGQAVPLSPGQKFRLALHTAIDPFYIGYALVVGGGYGELVDSHSGFGWGPAGYFKRVGASYADNVNGAIIGNALLPIVLHQDPRYFRKGTGRIFTRFLYAAESTVVCHGDNGKNQVNVSNVLGNFISGAISNAYYPANERGFGLTLENGAEVTAFGAVGGQILEFGPDLARLVHRHKKKSTPATPPSALTP